MRRKPRCYDCKAPPVEGRTRCAVCAEKCRLSMRRKFDGVPWPKKKPKSGMVKCRACGMMTRNPSGFCHRGCQDTHKARSLPFLQEGSNPRECQALTRPSQVDGTRDIWCERQARCRDYAMAAGWASFTCVHCPVREPEKLLDAIALQRVQTTCDDMGGWIL